MVTYWEIYEAIYRYGDDIDEGKIMRLADLKKVFKNSQDVRCAVERLYHLGWLKKVRDEDGYVAYILKKDIIDYFLFKMGKRSFLEYFKKEKVGREPLL